MSFTAKTRVRSRVFGWKWDVLTRLCWAGLRAHQRCDLTGTTATTMETLGTHSTYSRVLTLLKQL